MQAKGGSKQTGQEAFTIIRVRDNGGEVQSDRHDGGEKWAVRGLF